MVKDVPGKWREGEDSEQMEKVGRMMEAEREAEELMGFGSDDESSDGDKPTVATNTTR